jgi:hypothetical protein
MNERGQIVLVTTLATATKRKDRHKGRPLSWQVPRLDWGSHAKVLLRDLVGGVTGAPPLRAEVRASQVLLGGQVSGG